jgi:hypothetical protein
MLERTQTRLLPVVTRAGEHAPMAAACCNACRTCVTTNVLGIATAGAATVGAALLRFARLGRRHHSTA